MRYDEAILAEMRAIRALLEQMLQPRFADHVTGGGKDQIKSEVPFRPFGDQGVDVAGVGPVSAEEFARLYKGVKND